MRRRYDEREFARFLQWEYLPRYFQRNDSWPGHLAKLSHYIDEERARAESQPMRNYYERIGNTFRNGEPRFSLTTDDRDEVEGIVRFRWYWGGTMLVSARRSVPDDR